MRRIGIISGVERELALFLPDVARQPAEGRVDRVEHGGKELFLLCNGIGKVAAATAAATLHARFDVELLLVIGTAGKIGDLPGDLFNIVEAVQADFGAQRAEGLVHYTAGSWPIGPASVSAFRAMPLPGVDLPQTRIATSDLFIECGTHAARVREKLGAMLVDMETAAVAQAAHLLGTPWAAIKATTDSADDGSADNFVVNLDRAARAAAAAAERMIPLL